LAKRKFRKTSPPFYRLSVWSWRGVEGVGLEGSESLELYRSAIGTDREFGATATGLYQCKRVFITNVKGTFFGMSESEEASKRR
jgi:hypothetical protein